jgi:predicted KAP-like P-loop ATPase
MRQAQRRWRGHAQRRVVIFVDDLERCAADKALDMCEVVSQLLAHQDVVTVIVADLDLLEFAAEARYRQTGNDARPRNEYSEVGQEYLHKLIQLRFNLPPLDRGAVASSLGLAKQPNNIGEVPSV